MEPATRNDEVTSHQSQQRYDLRKHGHHESKPWITTGTGKSHLAEALAHAAIGRAKADGSVARTVTRICRCDLIVIDDIGMLPAGQDAAEAFYRITDAAYERRSVAVTSNIHPSKAHMFTATCARQHLKLDGFRCPEMA